MYYSSITADTIKNSIFVLIERSLLQCMQKHLFVVFDIETASTARTTELLQLSAITEDEKATFSENIMLKNPISSTATAIHKIIVGISGGQRQLYKDGKQISAITLQTCLTRFVQFLKTIYNLKPVDHLVLIGHNSFVFDTPGLLRNRACRFSNQLQVIKVLFSDSLPVLKCIRSQPNNVLKSSPNNKLDCVYKALFSSSSNELILAGKQQLKKFQKKKPEKNSGFDGA